MARIALLFVVGSWAGDLLLAIDSTAAVTANLTHSPPPRTLLANPFCSVVVRLRACQFETWLRAHHAAGSSNLLSTLNTLAHKLADCGAAR